MIKKTAAVLLLAATLLCVLPLFGCAKDDGIPDNMFSASLSGEPFIFYVPNDWQDNRDSGISSARFGLDVIASARAYVPEDENETLESFVQKHIEECKKNYETESVESKAAKLGKTASALRVEFDFKATEDAEKTKAVQYFAMNNGEAIMLSFYCKSADFDEYAEVFEQIRKEFVLTERTATENEAVTDKKTPDGMKLASNGLEYVFYIPTAWETDVSDSFSFAYYPEAGKPNVTVTSYLPNGEITAERYFLICEEDYEKSLSGYERLSEEKMKVAGREAIAYTYKTTYGGKDVKIMQTVLVYDTRVYSVTYTANSDRFDAHIDDVRAMLSAFRFR